MEVLECIKSRRSVRKFKDKEVAWDLIANIIDAGRFAPSSGNVQNWKFVVVMDEGKIESIAKACLNQMWIATAPVVIVVVGEPGKAEEYYRERGKDLYTVQNCAAATQNMLLEATNQGLGSCWISAFVPEQVKKILGMEKDTLPLAVIPVGYADEEPEQPMKWPLENICYFNGWRSKLSDPLAYMKLQSIKNQIYVNKGKEKVKKASKTVSEKAQEIIDNVKKKLKPEE